MKISKNMWEKQHWPLIGPILLAACFLAAVLFGGVFWSGVVLGRGSTLIWYSVSVILCLGLQAGVGVWQLVLQEKRHRTTEVEAQNHLNALKAELDESTRAQTALRRAHDAALAANEAKTRYLVSISHDVRSPLNTIYGYAQLLERGNPFPPKKAGAVIRQSTEYLTSLVEALLEVSKIESKHVEVQSDVVSIRDLLEHVIMMFRVQAQARGLKLDFIVHDPLPTTIRTDEKRLRQILVNLLSNAIKYTDEGCVTLSVHYRNEVARIEVSDTGAGIAADDLERVFEPFERGCGAQTQGKPGIGLGLAITRVLTQMLGGEITVDSHVGVGTTFCLRIMLPIVHNLSDTAEPTPSKGQIVGYKGKPLSVLVVDHDALQRDFLEALLVPLGFVVHQAYDGLSGLHAVAQFHPDMVLLSVKMPGEDDLVTAAKIRSGHPSKPAIIMVSAGNAELSVDADRATDYDAFVTKPVDSNTLLTTIGRVLHLEWIYVKDDEVEIDIPDFSNGYFSGLSSKIRQSFHKIRQASELGHVRGVENVLNSLAIETESDRVFIAIIKRYVRDFDLAAITRAINDAEL
ncbi:ATP-binding protein [Acetobacter tropicalis]|uniref:ATP-binding response regulator n=1 Tax=Acetobacter tropicalis TaxID=104102 RepID=UPI0039758714